MTSTEEYHNTIYRALDAIEELSGQNPEQAFALLMRLLAATSTQNFKYN